MLLLDVRRSRDCRLICLTQKGIVQRFKQGEFLRKLGEDPHAKQVFFKKLKKQIQSNEERVSRRVSQFLEYKNFLVEDRMPAKLKQTIEKMYSGNGLTEEQKQQNLTEFRERFIDDFADSHSHSPGKEPTKNTIFSEQTLQGKFSKVNSITFPNKLQYLHHKRLSAFVSESQQQPPLLQQHEKRGSVMSMRSDMANPLESINENSYNKSNNAINNMGHRRSRIEDNTKKTMSSMMSTQYDWLEETEKRFAKQSPSESTSQERIPNENTYRSSTCRSLAKKTQEQMLTTGQNESPNNEGIEDLHSSRGFRDSSADAQLIKQQSQQSQQLQQPRDKSRVRLSFKNMKQRKSQLSQSSLERARQVTEQHSEENIATLASQTSISGERKQQPIRAINSRNSMSMGSISQHQVTRNHRQSVQAQLMQQIQPQLRSSSSSRSPEKMQSFSEYMQQHQTQQQTPKMVPAPAPSATALQQAPQPFVFGNEKKQKVVMPHFSLGKDNFIRDWKRHSLTAVPKQDIPDAQQQALLKKIRKITHQTERFAGYFNQQEGGGGSTSSAAAISTPSSYAQEQEGTLSNGFVINSQLKVQLHHGLQYSHQFHIQTQSPQQFPQPLLFSHTPSNSSISSSNNKNTNGATKKIRQFSMLTPTNNNQRGVMHKKGLTATTPQNNNTNFNSSQQSFRSTTHLPRLAPPLMKENTLNNFHHPISGFNKGSVGEIHTELPLSMSPAITAASSNNHSNIKNAVVMADIIHAKPAHLHKTRGQRKILHMQVNQQHSESLS